jgi:hypothetical protein
MLSTVPCCRNRGSHMAILKSCAPCTKLFVIRNQWNQNFPTTTRKEYEGLHTFLHRTCFFVLMFWLSNFGPFAPLRQKFRNLVGAIFRWDSNDVRPMKTTHIALLLMSLVVFLWGTERQSARNTDKYATDQYSYIDDAKQFAQNDFQYMGDDDRIRMPLYPSVMALFYRDGMSDEEFFEKGKRIGIGIGISVLIATFFVLKQRTRTMHALPALLVAMFTVLAYKSPYFQPETLYYGLTLLLFVLLFSLIKQPRVQTACLAGVIAGIAHLTKASILPSVVLCVICLFVCATSELSRYNKNRDSGINQPFATRFNFLSPICCAAVLVMTFLLVIYPYIRTSKERYGSYFYNKNVTVFMWGERETNEHLKRSGTNLAPYESPSIRKYFREHNFGEMVFRLIRGVAVTGWRMVNSYGYAEFLIIYFLAFVALIAQNGGPIHFVTLFWRSSPGLVLFVVAYFAAYLSLYAWYTPLASGNRFILAQFLPLMFLITRGLSFAQNHNMTIRIHGTKFGASAISSTIVLFLMLHLVFVFPHRISTMYGGD